MKVYEVLIFLESTNSRKRSFMRGDRKQLVKREESVQAAAQSMQKLLETIVAAWRGLG